MFRWFATLLALALLPASPAHAQVSEAQFRSDILARLGKAMPGAKFNADPEDSLVFRIKGGPFNDAQISVRRVFVFCQKAAPADCEAEKSRFAAAVSKEPPTATSASLRLIVRDEQYVGSLREVFARMPPEKRTTVVFEPLGGGLYAILVSDSPDALRMVTELDLKDLGLTREQAWANAKRQTDALLPPVPVRSQLSGSAMLFEGHEFGGSLLIDLPAWSRLADEAGPNLFITVVSDNIVFVGVMADGPPLEAFKKTVAEDCLAQARCISPYIYRFRNGRWAVAD